MRQPEFKQRLVIESSNLSAVAYDPGVSTLQVEFKNGAKWNYGGVTSAQFAELISAPSIGSYFSRVIKALGPGVVAEIGAQGEELKHGQPLEIVTGAPLPQATVDAIIAETDKQAWPRELPNGRTELEHLVIRLFEYIRYEAPIDEPRTGDPGIPTMAFGRFCALLLWEPLATLFTRGLTEEQQKAVQADVAKRNAAKPLRDHMRILTRAEGRDALRPPAEDVAAERQRIAVMLDNIIGDAWEDAHQGSLEGNKVDEQAAIMLHHRLERIRRRILGTAAPESDPPRVIHPRHRIYGEVSVERAAQTLQWGGNEHDDEHSLDDWLTYIGLQVLKAGDKGSPDYRQRLVKIAALAVAAIESYDRKAAAPPRKLDPDEMEF